MGTIAALSTSNRKGLQSSERLRIDRPPAEECHARATDLPHFSVYFLVL
jgi:hypothetical protein